MNADLIRDARVAPSILASDFARLGEQVGEVMNAGARVIHVDVMDGHFVPPISIGALIVSALDEQVHSAGGWLDVHLMVERPERRVADFANAGADSITVHAEATPHAHYALGAVREAGCKAGLALNPGTPIEAIDALESDFDLLLCMTVNPGWGGQPYIPASDARIALLRERLPEGTPLEVDGGIDAATAGPAAAAGATLFVAGSSIFGSADPGAAYREIMAAAGGCLSAQHKWRVFAGLAAALAVGVALVLMLGAGGSDESFELKLERLPIQGGGAGQELVVSVSREVNKRSVARNGRTVTLECRDGRGSLVTSTPHAWPFIEETGYALPHTHQPMAPQELTSVAECRLTGTTEKLEGRLGLPG